MCVLCIQTNGFPHTSAIISLLHAVSYLLTVTDNPYVVLISLDLARRSTQPGMPLC